jgi:hypothetical protein
MKRAWLLGVESLLAIALLIQPSFGGHGGHGGGAHPAKAAHEPPKHAGGKPAPHPASKPPAKPQPKQLPKPQVKPKEANAHKPEPGKSTASHQGADLNRSKAIGSVSKNQHQTTKDDKTEHHDGHHRHWQHDRWWHGHHHVWSEEGYWVDAATGAPVVAADGGAPTGGLDDSPAGPTSGSAAAAQAAGMSRAEWIRSRLDAAVAKELK